MREKIIFYICVIFAVLILVPSEAFTDCPEDKMEVTIVQGRSGKVMTTCVSETDLPHIGGVGDIIIPAVCPCDDIGLKWIADLTCTRKNITCVSNDDDDDIDEVNIFVRCPLYPFPNIYYHGVSYSLINYYGFCEHESLFYKEYIYVTLDEAKACAAKVWAFAVHELGLDCVGEFPDFEPSPTP